MYWHFQFDKIKNLGPIWIGSIQDFIYESDSIIVSCSLVCCERVLKFLGASWKKGAFGGGEQKQKKKEKPSKMNGVKFNPPEFLLTPVPLIGLMCNAFDLHDKLTKILHNTVAHPMRFESFGEDTSKIPPKKQKIKKSLKPPGQFFANLHIFFLILDIYFFHAIFWFVVSTIK